MKIWNRLIKRYFPGPKIKESLPSPFSLLFVSLLLFSLLSRRLYSVRKRGYPFYKPWSDRDLNILYIGDIVNKRYKVHPKTSHEDPERDGSYSSTLSLTSALDRGGSSTPRPDRFSPGKEIRYPFYRRLGGPQGRPGRVWKISSHRDSIPGLSSP